jgi:hypothetical protein
MRIGYVLPLALLSCTLQSTGSGLYSLLQPSSPTGFWVGFQILAGSGSGLGLQLAMTSIQGTTTGLQLAQAMAFVVFCQTLGPAVALSLYNVVFDASLREQIPLRAPGVSAEAVIRAGATHFREVVGGEELPGVLVAYANSVDRVFYLVAAIAATCAVWAWGMGWQDVRKKEGAGGGASGGPGVGAEKRV